MKLLPFLRRSFGWPPTFRHGVHPAERKAATASLPIERMPFVDEYVIPLAQHIGAPAKAIVEPGQRVERGEKIADPGGFVSIAHHAPVTGTVRAIEPRPHPSGKLQPAIVIGADPFSSQRLSAKVRRLEKGLPGSEFIKRIQQAGMVGLGGAAFPSHVKLAVPEGKKVRFVLLNGCECEPYLTCDHRIMLEQPETVIRGLRLIMDQVEAERGYIGVENNKADAVEVLREAISRDGAAIEVFALQVKYPQGAEKMMIDAILEKEVPSGGLPLHIEMLVNNVGTAAAMVDLERTGQPLIERVVTVSGDGVRRPSNMLVPLGTPIKAVLDYCGGIRPDTRQVLLGGPMMGMAQKNLDAPIVKGTSGILASLRPAPYIPEEPCIRCSRCLEACPLFLNPSRLAILAREERVPELSTYHALDCFECAACSFVCPSHIPLVQLIRMGKAMVLQAEQAAKAAS